MNQKTLIIGTDEAYIGFIRSKTAHLNIELSSAETIHDATDQLTKGKTDIVFISDKTINDTFPETIQILKATASSPAILATGEGSPDMVEAAVKSGCSAYIPHETFQSDFNKQLTLLLKNRGSKKQPHDVIEDSPIKYSYKKPKIIVVDDSKLLRSLTKKMLPEDKYEVITAEDGKDCLNKLNSFSPDVILSDIVMPEMNGIELCETIKTTRKFKHIPVLLMSTESEIGRKINGFNVGAADYLTKPFEEEELRARITTHFLQRQLVSELQIENSKRKRAERELQNYTNKLEEIVSERTKEIETSHELLVKEISERKIIQAELEQNQKKYRELIETINDWLWEVSNQSILTYTSPKVFDLLGYLPDEVIGESVSILMSEQEVKKINQFVTENEKNINRLKSYRHTCLHKNGSEVTFDSSIAPFFDENNRVIGFRGVSRDITFIKKSVQEKARLEHQLLHSEKMASIGQLAAGVAHEINNPIGFINSNLHTLSDYLGDINNLLKKQEAVLSHINKESIGKKEAEMIEDLKQKAEEIEIDFIIEDAIELIDDCKDGINRVKDIVVSLKDFAHPGEKKKSFANINSNIDSTLSIVWNELKYNAEIVRNYGDIPEVKCNIQEINQVFMNLLVNAGHAIKTHGTINITTRCADEDNVEIKISDTGSGIPDEIKSKIFDPFFTTKSVGKGTGLGLNLSYNIITKHGGTIDVESEVGKGTSFTITLPAHSGEDDIKDDEYSD